MKGWVNSNCTFSSNTRWPQDVPNKTGLTLIKVQVNLSYVLSGNQLNTGLICTRKNCLDNNQGLVELKLYTELEKRKVFDNNQSTSQDTNFSPTPIKHSKTASSHFNLIYLQGLILLSYFPRRQNCLRSSSDNLFRFLVLYNPVDCTKEGGN